MGVKGCRVESKSLSCDLLVLIVRSDFSCIDNRVPHDVWEEADPKTSDTFVGNDFFIAVHRTIVRTLLFWESALSLKTDFYNVSGVGNGDADSTSGHTSKDFLNQSWVLTWGEGASNHVSHRDVKTDANSCKNDLSLESRDQTIKERQRSLFSSHFTHCP